MEGPNAVNINKVPVDEVRDVGLNINLPPRLDSLNTPYDAIAALDFKEIRTSSCEGDLCSASIENILVGSTSNGHIESQRGAWIAGHNRRDEYIFTILRKVELVTGVVTQGMPTDESRYIKKFCVYLHDSRNWLTTFDGSASWQNAQDEKPCYQFEGHHLGIINNFIRP